MSWELTKSHMVHINLNMIFYTHVDHSPTKTIHIKYYNMQKQWLEQKLGIDISWGKNPVRRGRF